MGIMEKSKFNIISKVHNTEDYFVINLLSGNADILDKDTYSKFVNENINNPEEFIEKGYLVEKTQENKLYKNLYLDFIDTRDTDEIQIFFVPWYTCNFACEYCFQDGYDNPDLLLKFEVIDAFFDYVNNQFNGRKKYITLFGGEPLLTGISHIKQNEYFFNKIKENNLDLAIVTNGYNVEEYTDLLKNIKIREIQITLDGVGDIHNERRPLKGGGATFDKIVKGIDKLLTNKINVNLRFVVDKQNINELPKLAKFSIEKGWTKSPFFKTQIGRNYELHFCQSHANKLFTRSELYKTIYEMMLENQEIYEFHQPAFSVAKYLYENGELPKPLFDSCPGCKTEWAFDYTGTIYSCTATVGKKGEELGKFYPQVDLYNDIIEKWQERDVTTIDGCKDCSVQLACGGGCAAIAKNKNGDILSKDCRPIKDLLELGISYYFYNK